jgi:hypothetical protein
MRTWLTPSLIVVAVVVIFISVFAISWCSAAVVTRMVARYRTRFPKKLKCRQTPKAPPSDFGIASRRPFGQRLNHFLGDVEKSHEIPPLREFQLLVPIEPTAPHKPKSPTLIARLLHHIRTLVRGIDNGHKNGTSRFSS